MGAGACQVLGGMRVADPPAASSLCAWHAWQVIADMEAKALSRQMGTESGLRDEMQAALARQKQQHEQVRGRKTPACMVWKEGRAKGRKMVGQICALLFLSPACSR